MLKATKVDGVYTADPKKDPTATRYTSVSFDEAISRNLQVLDATAFALCRDQKLPIKVFSIFKPGALKRVVLGEREGPGRLSFRRLFRLNRTVRPLQEPRHDHRRHQVHHRSQDGQVHRSLQDRVAEDPHGPGPPGILTRCRWDYYGSLVPISQVANVSLLDARTISVQPWEKGMGAKIERAIRESDLGLNPSSQGDLLRVPMPALTEERRKDLTKVVRHAEDCKVAVRNLRRDANEHLKKLLKDKAVSEDDERRAQDEVQKLTDRTVVEVDKLVHAKEAEILAV